MWRGPPMPPITVSYNRRSNGANERWERSRNRSWPMATTPITRRCKRRQACGVDFYGSWQDSWKPIEGRSAEFLASAFPYDAKRDCFTCPAGKILTHHALLNRGSGVHTHVYRAPKTACPSCPRRGQCAPQQARPAWYAVHHAHGRTCDDDGVQGEDGDGRGTADLRETLTDRGVPACLDQRALWLAAVPVSKPPEGDYGGHLGVPQLQPDKVVQRAAQVQSGNSIRLQPLTSSSTAT